MGLGIEPNPQKKLHKYILYKKIICPLIINIKKYAKNKKLLFELTNYFIIFKDKSIIKPNKKRNNYKMII